MRRVAARALDQVKAQWNSCAGTQSACQQLGLVVAALTAPFSMQRHGRNGVDLGPQLLPVWSCQRGRQIASEVRRKVRAFFVLEEVNQVPQRLDMQAGSAHLQQR